MARPGVPDGFDDSSGDGGGSMTILFAHKSGDVDD
jgi:hypothetical protein